MLAEKLELALAALLAKPQNYWGELKIPSFVEPILALDPSSLFQEQKRKLALLPLVTNYNIGESNRRNTIKQLTSEPMFQMVLSIPFDQIENNDVAPWDEIKKILILREKIEVAILGMEGIANAEPEPPMEVTYGVRWFMCTTDFTFTQQGCS